MIELDKDALEAAKDVWRGRWKHTVIPKLFIEDMIEMYLTTLALKNEPPTMRYDFLERLNPPIPLPPLKKSLWQRLIYGK